MSSDVSDQKFIFITGGVVSSIGKGLTSASLGALLEARGLKVSLMKCDPYINVDPGTMSPHQHGEVYVTEDGAETDLDLGHYERFTNVLVGRSHSVTAGQVYESVITKERKGEYLGGTVQVIPHITDEIKSRIFKASQGSEAIIVEIGGTIGDIEGLPFIEAIRQMRADVGVENSIYIHVTHIPYIVASGELKSKPTQHSVKELREVGIHPDFLICRSEKNIELDLKAKISLFCSVPTENVISVADSSIYEVPLVLHQEAFDKKVTQRLHLKNQIPNLSGWKKLVSTLKSPREEINIGMIGKYTNPKESYKSIAEALVHGGIANHCKIHISYIDSDDESLFQSPLSSSEKGDSFFQNLDAILIPGGFGTRGIVGKISSIQYARENNMPFLGICFGMQLACIEFAKNICGLKEATSHEFSNTNTDPRNFVIDLIEDQRSTENKGGTMRLGAYPCSLRQNTKAYEIYQTSLIHERHRHRFEFNNKYKSLFEKKGLICSGIFKDKNLVEMIELKNHPWFLGVQFHPEFKSKPLKPHPLFTHFIGAALEHKKKKKKKRKSNDDETSLSASRLKNEKSNLNILDL